MTTPNLIGQVKKLLSLIGDTRLRVRPSAPASGFECYWITRENDAMELAFVDGPHNKERRVLADFIALAPDIARHIIAQEERLKAAEKLAEAVHAEAIAATLELNDPKNGERRRHRREKRAELGDALANYHATGGSDE